MILFLHSFSSSRYNHNNVGPLKCEYGTIPSREVASRIQDKINVAKETGDIQNERYRNFLAKSAEAYGIDKRQFNGYK